MDRADEILETYNEAIWHFKKAIIFFAISITSFIGALFYMRFNKA